MFGPDFVFSVFVLIDSTGTKHGYHGLTMAMLLNEIIVRVDAKHRTLSQFFKEEVAVPWGMIPKHFLSARFLLVI